MVCTKEVSFSINVKVEGVPLSHAVAQDSVLVCFLVTKDLSDKDPQNIKNPRQILGRIKDNYFEVNC